MMRQEINRLKVVLAEKKRTNRWLAAQLEKNEATISKWCTNSTQPSLDDLVAIAKCLEVDTKDLLHSITE
ncbi:Cro/C1-type HTH DNA-binding domain-containing protein [Parabacteroides chinchillae]|uniref:Cro/C1-type HTH DNA-binding domain-containing protein n=2 Tax=Parabacteroides chinchillae TaxID=871327 RepID=A0A8G2BYW3_9BACT|nr:Cro/C1-type HTH DNA-binding domain-containing protein [Parabacteroides chinchillae]